MRRISWLTDIHLDACSEAGLEALAKAASTLDGCIVITGDLSIGPALHRHLALFAEHATSPVYFVLGNHDYWYSTIADVRRTVAESCAAAPSRGTRPALTYLRDSGPIKLSDRTCLVGVDGWCDARAGNLATPVMMNDFLFCEDLADVMAPGSVLGWKHGVSRASLHHKLQALASSEAALLRRKIAKALRMKIQPWAYQGKTTSFERVVIAMHVPPFVEATWHEGQHSSDDYLPYFTSLCMGKMLREVAAANRKVHFTVLCGHTHGAGVYQAEPNLLVRTGEAVYRWPKVQGIFDVDTL